VTDLANTEHVGNTQQDAMQFLGPLRGNGRPGHSAVSSAKVKLFEN